MWSQLAVKHIPQLVDHHALNKWTECFLHGIRLVAVNPQQSQIVDWVSFFMPSPQDLAQIVRDVTRYGGAYRPEVRLLSREMATC